MKKKKVNLLKRSWIFSLEMTSSDAQFGFKGSYFYFYFKTVDLY